jgi:hypothetical protein
MLRDKPPVVEERETAVGSVGEEPAVHETRAKLEVMARIAIRMERMRTPKKI